jgi:hypothetical protein
MGRQLKLIASLSPHEQKNGLNGGQAITTTWASPSNSLKSNKPTLEDDRDPDVIPSYHQYGINKLFS